MQRRIAESSRANSPAPGIAASVRKTLQSSGAPLDATTRAHLEPRFGYDFSRVRIHSDAKAAGSAREVNALAYTVGSDVVFGAGQYSPGTPAGQTLLAHELAHVVQQGGTAYDSGRSLRIDAPDSALEHEAEQAAADVGHHPMAQPGGRNAGGLIQRVPDNTPVTEQGSNHECAGWLADRESLSKRAAELYVRTELAGKHGTVQKIECDMTASNGAFACTVRFSDGANIRVIARPDSIVVGVAPIQSMHPSPDRPLCFYSFACPGPNRDLVLTKIKCNVAQPPGNSSNPSHAQAT